MQTKRLQHALSLVAIVALSWLPMASVSAAPAPEAQAAACAQSAAASAAGPATLPCGVGEVSGTIRAGDTGLPMANVGVVAAGFSYRTTTTDSNGHYAFDYQIANGPTPITLGINPTGRYIGVQQNSLFDVVSGTVKTMNFTLNVGATIAGVVHATDVITGLENVSVVLSPTSVLAGTPLIERFGSTDSSGAYQFQGLAAGHYKLKFDPTFDSTFDFNLNKYVPTYYGGAGDAESAAEIIVTTPTTITANITLTPGATIQGDVTGVDTGTGLKSYSAYVYSPSKPEIRADAVRIFDTSSYSAQGLRPGTYVLVVSPGGPGTDSQDYIGQYYNDKTSPGSANLITVSSFTQTVDIPVALQRGGVITGAVKDANTHHPVADVRIDFASDVPDLIFPNGTFGSFATTDASGIYTATGLPSGHYTADFTFEGGVTPPYYSQVYNGHDIISETVAGDLVAVTAPFTVTNINFSLHPILTGTVAGRVTDALGQGIQFVSVQLNRADTDPASAFGRIYAYTDANGYYTTTVDATSYFVEFKRDTTALCGGCFNDQFYTGVGQSTPKAVLVHTGALVSGINARLLCGQAVPKHIIYIPVAHR